jgi:hypothetical protein
MPGAADELITGAAALLLLDTAYAIWRQEITIERLEVRGHFPRQWIACLCGQKPQSTEC